MNTQFDFKNYNHQVKKVLFSFLLFIICYFIFLSIAAVILYYSIYFGLGIIINYPRIITFIVGAGIMIFGLMNFFFLIKFIFKKSIKEETCEIEIFQKDEKELFKIIEEICTKLETPLPHKVKLVPDVNAALMMKNNFFNLFIPPKKTLVIGLGLVNILNKSELKAILAHEFGHFSQKSTRLGSYLYVANNIIHTMVYQNDKWDQLLIQWANVGSIFSLFAIITSLAANGVRFIMDKLFILINKSNMKLSQQMEFHADYVSATLYGGNNAKNALRKIDLAEEAFQLSGEACYKLNKTNIICADTFKVQEYYIRVLAEKNNIPFKNDLPVISKEQIEANMAKSKLKYHTGWESHPTLEQRENEIDKYKINKPEDTDLAWTIFNNADTYKKQLTTLLYELNLETNHADKATKEITSDELKKLDQEFSFDEKFENIFNHRNINKIEYEEIDAQKQTANFEELFNKENKIRIDNIIYNELDYHTLSAINRGDIIVSEFEYDKQIYPKKKVWSVMQSIQKKLEEDTKWLKDLDTKIFKYFLKKNKTKGKSELVKSLIVKRNLIFETKTILGNLNNNLIEIFQKMQSKIAFEEFEINQFRKNLYQNNKDFKDIIDSITLNEKNIKYNDKPFIDYILNGEETIKLKHSLFEDDSLQKYNIQQVEIINKLNELEIYHLNLIFQL